MDSTTAATSRVGPLRVLVVDDYPAIAEILVRWLKRLGHEVETVMSGSDAIKAAENGHPDVMFVDLAMPDLNGFQVARQIRQQPWSQTLFLIALSGFSSEEDRKQAEEAGFDTYLRKPISSTEIEAVLACAGGRSCRSAERAA
jgi:CheY-like chemotaxis protein